MMVFIGSILLITFAVGTINGGFFINSTKEVKNFNKYMETEEYESMGEDKQAIYALKLLVKAITMLVVSLVLSITTVCFLIGALSIDVILVPTVVLLVLYIVKIIRAIISKEYREKNNKREMGTFREKLRNGVYFLYVLYILILVIL